MHENFLAYFKFTMFTESIYNVYKNKYTWLFKVILCLNLLPSMAIIITRK